MLLQMTLFHSIYAEQYFIDIHRMCIPSLPYPFFCRWTSELTNKQKQTHRLREQTYSYQGERVVWEGQTETVELNFYI